MCVVAHLPMCVAIKHRRSVQSQILGDESTQLVADTPDMISMTSAEHNAGKGDASPLDLPQALPFSPTPVLHPCCSFCLIHTCWQCTQAPLVLHSPVALTEGTPVNSPAPIFAENAGPMHGFAIHVPTDTFTEWPYLPCHDYWHGSPPHHTVCFRFCLSPPLRCCLLHMSCM